MKIWNLQTCQEFFPAEDTQTEGGAACQEPDGCPAEEAYGMAAQESDEPHAEQIAGAAEHTEKSRRQRPQKSARERALSLLEHADRTEKEMRRKLREREYEERDIDEAMVFLKEYHFIDDAEYARRYVRTYASRKSVLQIRVALGQKGIARELVDDALGETEVDEATQIRALMLKKGYRPGERMEAAAYRRMTGALMRKGFSYEQIRRVTEQLNRGEDDFL